MGFSGRAYVVVALVGLTVSATLLGRTVLRREEPEPLSVSTTRGGLLYEMHCAVCHGLSGKGDGPGARVIRQPMRDFTNPSAMREVNDRFLFEIVKKGSSQFGRSNAMPSWGMKLSDEEIRDVVAHIRSLASGAPGGPDRGKETP